MNSSLATPLPSKWGTLYLPPRVGIRLSVRGTQRLVSSRVDQMTCFTPVSLAVCAMVAASAISFSAE